MKNVTIFHLEIIFFTAVKYCGILHGRVFVMLHKNLKIFFKVDLVSLSELSVGYEGE